MGGGDHLKALVSLIFLTAACADTSGPRSVETVAIQPDSMHLSPGESGTFYVHVLDQRGNPMDPEWAPQIDWSVTNPEVASVDPAGGQVTVTALAEGFASLRGELGPARNDVPIWVRPDWLDSIAVDPNPIVVSYSGRRDARVRVFDQTGEERSATTLRISFEMLNPDLFSFVNRLGGGNHLMRIIGQEDLDPASLPAETELRVIVNGLIVYADVIVIAAPTGPGEAPTVEVVSDTRLELEWERIFGVFRYEVHRATSIDGPYELVATPAPFTQTSYLDTGLTPATTYWYKIGACNAHGCATILSPPGSGTTGGGS